MPENKFLRFIVGAFVAGGLVLLLGRPEWFPARYMPRAMGATAFLYAFIVILPGLIFRLPEGQEDRKRKAALVNFQMAVAIGLYLDGIGSLGFFHLQTVGIPYDKLIHFVVPVTFMVVATNSIRDWYGTPSGKAMLITASLVMLGGVTWELLEFSSDVFFHTRRFGVYGQNVRVDTMLDLLMDVVGISTGAAILFYRKRKPAGSPLET